MTDDIDAQSLFSMNPKKSRTYVFCPKCGMVMIGGQCGFCKDLKEPKRTSKRWFGKLEIK